MLKEALIKKKSVSMKGGENAEIGPGPLQLHGSILQPLKDCKCAW